jgi:hypothetical protein
MSQGMRFSDMRDKLRQAAIERARRDSQHFNQAEDLEADGNRNS